MKRNIKVKGALKAYLRWPIMLSLLLVCMNIGIYLIDQNAGIVMLGFVVLYVIIAMLLYFFRRPNIIGDLIRYAADYGQVQKQLLKEMALPYAILDYEGRLLWGNNELLDIIENENTARKSISNIFPEITTASLPRDMQDKTIRAAKNNSYYKIILRKIIAVDFSESAPLEYDDM